MGVKRAFLDFIPAQLRSIQAHEPTANWTNSEVRLGMDHNFCEMFSLEKNHTFQFFENEECVFEAEASV